ncbi:MAG: hypothetical protein HY516_02050 [Candidatus Aenigmarchaeota archaeon]|nr:hypothetical protein [Candidatus Aenigmarchaeota archaeon]
MDKEQFKRYQKLLIENRRSEENIREILDAGGACFICRENDPRVLQKHHVFGRNNSKVTVCLCQNCHKIVTDNQNKLPLKIRKKSNAYNPRMEDISIGSLLRCISDRLNKRGFFDE